MAEDDMAWPADFVATGHAGDPAVQRFLEEPQADASAPPRPLPDGDIEILRVLTMDCRIVRVGPVGVRPETVTLVDAAGHAVDLTYSLQVHARYRKKGWIERQDAAGAYWVLSQHGRECLETGSDLPREAEGTDA